MRCRVVSLSEVEEKVSDQNVGDPVPYHLLTPDRRTKRWGWEGPRSNLRAKKIVYIASVCGINPVATRGLQDSSQNSST